MFGLSMNERRALERLRRDETEDRTEYVRATCLLMRWRGMSVKDTARELDVSEGAVYKWEASFRKEGIDALRTKKTKKNKQPQPPGRPSFKKKENGENRERIPGLMMVMGKDPQAFGFLEGRRVVRDVSKSLKKEGGDISPTPSRTSSTTA
jgi:transposase-like protein